MVCAWRWRERERAHPLTLSFGVGAGSLSGVEETVEATHSALSWDEASEGVWRCGHGCSCVCPCKVLTEITTTAKRTQTFGRQGDGVEITLGLMNAEQ